MNGLFLLLLVAQPDRTQAEADFRAANELALQGDLPGAIGLYDTLIDRGFVDADVYYNLGNARAQAGDEIEAIVAYERALRLAPGDPEILANLRFVRGEEDGAASLTAADLIEPVVAHLPLELFGWLTAALNALFFFLLWMSRRRRTRAAIGGAVLSFVMLLGSALAVIGHAVVALDARGVLTTSAELREGPHPKFKSKGPAIVGGRVRVVEEVEGYIHVLQQDGTSGWVPLRTVTRV